MHDPSAVPSLLKPKRVLLVQSGHSGSTLLSLILNGHSQVVSVGEWHNLNKPDELCSCRKKIVEDPFWSDLLPTLPQHGLEIHRKKKATIFGKHSFTFLTGGEVDNDMLRNVYAQMYTHVMNKSGKAIVMSATSPETAEILAADTRWDTYIIHLVRDGRAVTWSYIKKYGHPFKSMLRWAGPNMKIELLKLRTSVPTLLVSYEMLVNCSEKELRRILSFIGGIYEPDIIEFGKQESHLVGGNRMRFSHEGKIVLDEEWKKCLPRTYQILFCLLFGVLNFKYTRCKR